MIRHSNYEHEEVYNQLVYTLVSKKEHKKELEKEDLDYKYIGKESLEEELQRILNDRKYYGYVIKTIKSGDLVESEIYPWYGSKKDIPRKKDRKDQRETQNNLNHKNTQKHVIRLMSCNFTKEDYIVTLTWEDKYYPTYERAKKDFDNWLAKVKRWRDKRGLPPPKYIYALEYLEEGETTKKVRMNIHVIISGTGRENKAEQYEYRDMLETKWTRGPRCETRKVVPDDYGLTGFAKYITKGCQDERKHARKWNGSQNLTKPTITKNHTKITRKKAENMFRDNDFLREVLETTYKNKYKFLDCEANVNEYVSGIYFYARMCKRD